MDLDNALAKARVRGRPAQSPAEKLERQRRRTIASNMAISALRAIHQEEFATFYRQALDKVDAERGPLPD